ncbi:hypothetical protein H7I76_06775 [Mycolicibacterium vaccae]|nr:hypothetical protein [Mycolicibacterium vaccae]
MQQSLIVVVVLMQIIIYLVADNLPVAQPKIIHKILIFIGTLAVVVFTFLDVDFYQMIMSLHPLVFFGVTTTLSVIPPLLGLLESKLKANGERIYSTGGMPGTTNRLPIHLLTNLAGALIVVLLAWVARRYATPSGIVSDWLVSGLAVNILLPLATMSTLAFVRLQQTRACPELDDRVKNGQPFAECIAGYSLRYLHQFSNVLYLIFVTFFGGATFLYVLATLIEGAYNDGNSSTASLASIIGVASAISDGSLSRLVSSEIAD